MRLKLRLVAGRAGLIADKCIGDGLRVLPASGRCEEDDGGYDDKGSDCKRK
jgi:hypothetical protein